MCNICGNETIKLKINNISYDFCNNCYFLAKDRLNYLSEIKEKERYLNHNNDTLDYYHFQESFFESIKEYIGSNVLDFGCGKDQVLINVLKNNKVNATGYDYYFLPNKYDINSFDTVIIEEVIEHLKNPIETLKSLINRNNPSFKIIIKTELFSDVNSLNNWWYLRDSTHIGFYHQKTFEKIAEILNLKILFSNKKNIIILAL